MLQLLGGFAYSPNVRNHDLVLRLIGSIKLADDELGIRKGLDVFGSCSVAELYPRDEGSYSVLNMNLRACSYRAPVELSMMRSAPLPS